MKNHIFYVVLCLGLLFQGKQSNAQVSPDAAWYIRNTNGWNGESNRFMIPITNQSLISGVKVPNVGCNPNASHDIFVIYKNGLHYNSRNNSSPQRLNYENINSQSVLPFQNKTEDIAFAYLTSNYDVEPPPPSIKANASLSGSDPAQMNAIVYSSPKQSISANHCVVPQKDITLIIKNSDTAKTYMVDLTNFFWTRNNVVVNTYTKTDSYKSSPVFNGQTNNGFVLYGNTPEINPSMFKFEKVDSAFAYVNIKAVDVPTPLSLRIPNFNPNTDTVYARFILSNENGVVDTLDEPILDAFDPNYLHAKSICKNNSKRYVYYEGHFHNTSLVPADGLAFEFTVPNTLSITDIQDWNIEVEGNALSSADYTVQINGRVVLVKLTDTISCRSCVNTVPESGEVDFSFYILVDPSQSSTSDDDLQIDLTNTRTYFFYNTTNQHIYDLLYEDRSWYYIMKQDQRDTVLFEISSKTRLIEGGCEGFPFYPDKNRPIWSWIIGLILIVSIIFFGRKLLIKAGK